MIKIITAKNVGRARFMPLHSIVKVQAHDLATFHELSHWGFQSVSQDPQWWTMRRDLRGPLA